MINEEPTMSAGNGGFTGAAAPTGPNAGLDPMLGKGKVRRKKKKCDEEVDRHNHTPNRLLQYKVSIPEVGDTIIYAQSPAELMQKMRLLVNPRYRGDVKIERIMPGEAAKFFMDKRSKALARKRFDESVEITEADDKQMKQQQANLKMQMLKKNVELKKQELQKNMQKKLANIKQKSRVGADQSNLGESSGGNIDAIKEIAQSGEHGMVQFQKGGAARMSPQLAKQIWDAYESLGKQKNRAKFSNAANESEASFQRILNFIGGEQQ